MSESTIAFYWAGLSLVGTLRLPPGDGPHPLVVMLQGSGPADRTNNGYFPPIQEAFLHAGIATFAFDKPGCGDSSGDWRDHALGDRADQALAAIRAAQLHIGVAAGHVGVFGHSQGGWITQMLGRRPDEVAFAIASSGPSISVAEQDVYGCEHSMRADGWAEDDIESAVRLVRSVHDAARRGLSYRQLEGQLLEPVRDQPWYGAYGTIDDEQDWNLEASFVNEDYQPLEAMHEIQSPFLAVYGGDDVLVPAWLSAQQTGEALRAAGNSRSTIVVFPRADHRIQDESLEFVDGYLDLLVTWTAKHALWDSRPKTGNSEHPRPI